MPFAMKLAAGALLGAALAATGIWLGSASVDTAAPSTTLATTTLPPIPAEPAWIPEGGIRFASTILIPQEIDANDGVLTFDYELASLAGSSRFSTANPPALPETWGMTSAAGAHYETTTNPPRIDTFSELDRYTQDSARFDVPAEFESSDVRSIAVTGWRIAVPMNTVIHLSSERGSSITLGDGTVIMVDTILEQRNGTIIGFDVDAPIDPWRTAADTPFGLSTTFTGSGPGWLRSATRTGGTGLSGGATGFQLMWDGPTAPPDIALAINTTAWMPLDSTATVYEGGANG
ncbi:MAG: hypothetical protein ABFR89_05925 [Actinomycetota bacterium]